MSGQSQGALSSMSIDGNLMCFSKVLNKTTTNITDAAKDAICGTYRHDKARTSRGTVTPKLHIFMEPTPQEADVLWPLLGFAETPTDIWTPIEDFSALVDFDVILDYGPSVDTYTNGIADKVIIRAQKGRKPWSIEMQVYFDAYIVDNGGVFSDTAVAGNTTPYTLMQSTLTLNAATELTQSSIVVIDYKTKVQHNNSYNPTSIIPSDREIFFGVDTPYTADEVALLAGFTGETDGTPPADAPSSVGYAGDIVFASGGLSTKFDFHNLKLPEAEMPSILGKEEIRNKMFFKAFGSTSVAELIITNDITP